MKREIVDFMKQPVKTVVTCEAIFVGNFLIAQRTEQEVFQHSDHLSFEIMMVKWTPEKSLAVFLDFYI